MPDDFDRTYKWRCSHCSKVMEETDPGMLEARKQAHLFMQHRIAPDGQRFQVKEQEDDGEID